LAIFTEIGSNFLRCDEQHSWRPHGRCLEHARGVARAIWRISIRAELAGEVAHEIAEVDAPLLKQTVTRRCRRHLDVHHFMARPQRDEPPLVTMAASSRRRWSRYSRASSSGARPTTRR